MGKNPEYQIELYNPAMITVMDYVSKLAGLTDEGLKKHITEYFVSSDVIGLFEIFEKHKEMLFETALRLRERKLGPLPESDVRDDGDPDDEKSPAIDYSHPLICEWLDSKPDSKFMIVAGTLAEEIFDSISQESGGKTADENIEKCPDPAFAKALLMKTREKFLLFIERIIKEEFGESVRKAYNIAKIRAMTGWVL